MEQSLGDGSDTGRRASRRDSGSYPSRVPRSSVPHPHGLRTARRSKPRNRERLPTPPRRAPGGGHHPLGSQTGQELVRRLARLYDHLCGVEFRQHIEAIVEAFCGLQEQLAAEQRAFARQWKEREQQLQKAITHTAMLYGGVQGIAGREALPEIQPLQLAPPTD
jgi:hypothetical protein